MTKKDRISIFVNKINIEVLYVDCLAAADNLVILTEDNYTAITQKKSQKESQREQVSKIITKRYTLNTCIVQALKFLKKNTYASIKRVFQFKYLDETTQDSGLKKIANEID